MKNLRWLSLIQLTLALVALTVLSVGCQRGVVYQDEVIYTNAPSVLKTETNLNISLNTVGYQTGSKKVATIGAVCSYFVVYQSNTTTLVYSNGTVVYGVNSSTAETLSLADFSSITAPGNYALIVPEIGKTNYFSIAADIYNNAFKTAMLGMYLARCGTAVSATYNGITYNHAACHLNDADASKIGTSAVLNGEKGWHDAGDYNKYTVNAGVSVGLMLKAWESYSDKINTLTLNVPEHGNGIPDYLSEIKWELDWLLTMQYTDGSGRVSHKLSSLAFDAFEMPEDDLSTRYFSPYGTCATAHFVAMMAIAARVYGPYDSAYSNQCINAAI